MNSLTGLPDEALFDGRDISVDGAVQDAHIADSSLHFTAASLGGSYIPVVGGVADNVVAKFHTDGTVQASGVVISDTTNDITGVGDLTIGGTFFGDGITTDGALDMTSTSNALTLPKLQPYTRDTLTTSGSLVYDSVNNKLNFYNGTGWQQLSFTAADPHITPAFAMPVLSAPTGTYPGYQGYTVTASSVYSTYAEWKPFFSSSIGGWTAALASYVNATGLPTNWTFNPGTGVVPGSWLKVQTDVVRKISSYELQVAANTRPVQWKIYHSFDGVTWTLNYHQSSDFDWTGITTTGSVALTPFDCNYVLILVTKSQLGYSSTQIDLLTYT